MFGIIKLIIVGFIVGLIARALMPGDQKLSLLWTTLLGILGSVAAGVIASLIGGRNPLTDFEPGGWIASILGALVLLFIGMKAAPRLRT